MIDWTKVYKLSAGEFSEDPNKYAEPRLIYSLGDLRQSSQERMFPSPVKGTLARHGGSKKSQHYVGPKRLFVRKSTGADIFMEGVPIFNYSTILSRKLFTGIGIYLDTNGIDGKPAIMFHLDIRKIGYTKSLPLIWIAEKVWDSKKYKKVTKYRYPQIDPTYWRLLQDERLYRSRQYSV